MRYSFLPIVIVFAFGLLTLSSEEAKPQSAAMPTPLVNRIAHADLIVLGRVTKIEDKGIQAKALPNSPQLSTYKVGEIEVKEVLYGPKLERARVANRPRTVDADGKLVFPGAELELESILNQDGLIFLPSHYTGDFYQLAIKSNFFLLGGVDRDRYVEECRRILRLIADPKKSLMAKDPRDRLITASILLHRYRRDRYLQNRTEEIDAEESKLILRAIASPDIKWNDGSLDQNGIHPSAMFRQLRLRESDGWKEPGNDVTSQQREAQIKRWIEQNAESYKIRRYLRNMQK